MATAVATNTGPKSKNDVVKRTSVSTKDGVRRTSVSTEDGGKRTSVPDVVVTFMNVLKFRDKVKKHRNSLCSDNGSDCERTLNLRARALSVATSKESSTDLTMRRRSTLKGLAKSITGLLNLRRMTIPKAEPNKPVISYENTYKMGPEKDSLIIISTIEQIAENILSEEISKNQYSSIAAGKMACRVSDRIKREVKGLDIPRYRIICQVIITEVKDQGLEASSRCLWDPALDNYTEVTYRNDSICAVAMIYGIYLE